MEVDKTHLLIAGAVGMVLADLLPTPADALYFHRQQKNKHQLTTGEITPKQYWRKEAVGYYTYNTAWWLIVLGATVYFGSDFKQKRNIMLGLIAGGAALAVLHKNIEKDEEFYATHEIVNKKPASPNIPTLD